MGEPNVEGGLAFSTSLTLNGLGTFANFREIYQKFSIGDVSATTHTREIAIARLKGMILGFHFDAPVTACPILQNFSLFFFRYRRFVATPHFVSSVTT